MKYIFIIIFCILGCGKYDNNLKSVSQSQNLLSTEKTGSLFTPGFSMGASTKLEDDSSISFYIDDQSSSAEAMNFIHDLESKNPNGTARFCVRYLGTKKIGGCGPLPPTGCNNMAIQSIRLINVGACSSL